MRSRHPLFAGYSADLLFWKRAFLGAGMLGRSFEFLQASFRNTTLTVYTDAATTKGLHCGGYFVNRGLYFSERWPEWMIKKFDINFLELFAIIIAIRLWSEYFRGTSVALWTDNRNAMRWLAKKSVSLPLLETHMPLVRFVCHKCYETPFRFYIDYVEGIQNPVADDLSRGVIPPHLDPGKRVRFDPAEVLRFVLKF